MNPETRRELRDYAWKYFELHAEHRLKAFGFFVLLSSAIVGGFVTIVTSSKSTSGLWLLPFSLIFLNFVFWKFEERTRALVKNGEDVLKYLDSTLHKIDGEPHPTMLFHIDDRATESARKYSLVSGHFSYSRCIRWVLGFFALVGVGGVIVTVAA